MYDFTDFRELLNDGKKCCNGYRWKQSVQMFEMHIIRWTAKNRRELISYKWNPRKTHDFIINERGKKREIKAHYIRDRQVYKAYNRLVLKPSFESLLIETNSASREGKGTHYAIKRFRQDLAYAYKKCGTDFYIVTYDFHNYFYSINHDQIYNDILNCVIDRPDIFETYLSIFEEGVGIGGEPSQTIAITYPHKLDRHLLCSQRVLRSGRFMDDGYAICKTKEDAQIVLKEVYEYSYNLKLIINEKHTRISYMKEDSVIFLKKRTRITKSGKIIMHLTRKNVNSELRRIRYQANSENQPMESILQSFHSWCSYALKYGGYYQVIRVSHYFSNMFNIPYEEVIKLWKNDKNH